LVLVVGSKNSANSNRLVEVVKGAGGRAYLIEDKHAIEPAWLENAQAVALSAGASAPEVLVERVAERLRALGFTNVEDVEVIPEDVRFNLPAELVSFAPASR
jgi:4-hydroxy-3-methylbut-2-enyl diphosphate reductase